MAWVYWVLLAIAIVAVVWSWIMVVRFARLQQEFRREQEADQRALKAFLVRLFLEAKSAGNVGAARQVQMQAFAVGVDVEKEAAWKHAS